MLLTREQQITRLEENLDIAYKKIRQATELIQTTQAIAGDLGDSARTTVLLCVTANSALDAAKNALVTQVIERL